MTDLVNFELAKLLKEKKCDLNHEYMVFTSVETEKYPEGELFLKPTIAEVVMWLYEKHGIWIKPIPSIIEHNKSSDTLGWVYNIYTLEVYLKRGNVWGEPNNGCYTSSYYYNSPIKAYEAAIEYVLTNLINNKPLEK